MGYIVTPYVLPCRIRCAYQAGEWRGSLPLRRLQTVDKQDADCCPQCGRKVYFAEEILALKRKWHRLCFKCGMLHTWELALREPLLDGRPLGRLRELPTVSERLLRDPTSLLRKGLGYNK